MPSSKGNKVISGENDDRSPCGKNGKIEHLMYANYSKCNNIKTAKNDSHARVIHARKIPPLSNSSIVKHTRCQTAIIHTEPSLKQPRLARSPKEKPPFTRQRKPPSRQAHR